MAIMVAEWMKGRKGHLESLAGQISPVYYYENASGG